MRHCWLSAKWSHTKSHKSLSTYSRCHRKPVWTKSFSCPGITQQIWTLSPPQFVFIADLECPVCPQAHPVSWERGWETAHTWKKITGSQGPFYLLFRKMEMEVQPSSGTRTGKHGRMGFYQTLTWWSHEQLFARKFLQVLTKTPNPVAYLSPNTPSLCLRDGHLGRRTVALQYSYAAGGGVFSALFFFLFCFFDGGEFFPRLPGGWNLRHSADAERHRCVRKHAPGHGKENELNTSEHSRR